MNSLGSSVSGIRSTAAKGMSGASKAGTVGKKAYAWGGKFLLHAALYLVLGILLGALSLIDTLRPNGAFTPTVLLSITAVVCLVLGIFHTNWVTGRGEGQRQFWPELGMVLVVALALALGILVGHLSPPLFDLGVGVFAWNAAAASGMLMMPMLLWWTFGAGLAYEPRRYELWFYPKHYREQQPTWNKDRVMIANLHFNRKANEDIHTTVNARLPEEALLGELIYLFIKDYNENRFPNDPIKDLRRDDGSLGWLFVRKRFVFTKQRRWAWSTKVLDPALTVFQNGISRDADVYLERVIETTTNDE